MRKKNQLTQSSLAEQMGVSPQAVSNWERGESMPDIACLMQLAGLLGVTTDRLLAAAQSMPPAELAEEAALAADSPAKTLREKLLDLVKGEKGPAKELGDKAILSMVDELLEEIDDAAEGQEPEEKPGKKSVHVHISHGGAGSGDDDGWNEIISLAPFASPEKLARMLESLEATADVKKIVRLAPYLEEEQVESLVRRAVEADSDVSYGFLMQLAPFCSGQFLHQLALDGEYTLTVKQIKGIAPFLPEGAVDTLIDRALNKQ